MLPLLITLLGTYIAYTSSTAQKPNALSVTNNSIYGSKNLIDLDHYPSRIPSNLGFNRGKYTGRKEFGNPLPYRTVNEGRNRLLETQFGPPPFNKNAIDPVNLKRLIHQKFNLEVYPLLDPTRLDISKGRTRRRQNSFYISD